MGSKKPSIHIIVTAEGVDRVRLYGGSWDDGPEASRLFRRISPLVAEIDRVLKAQQRAPPTQVM